VYNIKRKIKVSKENKYQTFIFLNLKIYLIWDNAGEDTLHGNIILHEN